MLPRLPRGANAEYDDIEYGGLPVLLAAMADAPGYTDVSRPEWFAAFLADRGTRKPSAHTMKAYRRDFDAIAALAAGDAAAVARMPLGVITTDSMRTGVRAVRRDP